MGRRVLALLLGIRGEETERGPPGARPKLEGEGEGEGERERGRGRGRGGGGEGEGEGEGFIPSDHKCCI